LTDYHCADNAVIVTHLFRSLFKMNENQSKNLRTLSKVRRAQQVIWDELPNDTIR